MWTRLTEDFPFLQKGGRGIFNMRNGLKRSCCAHGGETSTTESGKAYSSSVLPYVHRDRADY